MLFKLQEDKKQQWYPGTITAVKEGDQVQVAYDDGDSDVGSFRPDFFVTEEASYAYKWADAVGAGSEEGSDGPQASRSPSAEAGEQGSGKLGVVSQPRGSGDGTEEGVGAKADSDDYQPPQGGEKKRYCSFFRSGMEVCHADK